MRRGFVRRAVCAAMPSLCLLLAACAGTVPGVSRAVPWTLVVITAARGQGIHIDRMPVASLAACSAIEQIVSTMRTAGIDRTTTARCEPGDAAI